MNRSTYHHLDGLGLSICYIARGGFKQRHEYNIIHTTFWRKAAGRYCMYMYIAKNLG